MFSDFLHGISFYVWVFYFIDDCNLFTSTFGNCCDFQFNCWKSLYFQIYPILNNKFYSIRHISNDTTQCNLFYVWKPSSYCWLLFNTSSFSIVLTFEWAFSFVILFQFYTWFYFPPCLLFSLMTFLFKFGSEVKNYLVEGDDNVGGIETFRMIYLLCLVSIPITYEACYLHCLQNRE